MRDYEDWRNDPRSRQRLSLPDPPIDHYGSEEEEDDVQFVEGQETIPFPPDSNSMDVDGPSDQHRSRSSSGPLHTPALSNTASSVSSPVLSLTGLPHDLSSPVLTRESLPLTATRSEKALAAITLAMANGAGSIDEYDALRAVCSSSSGDEPFVGELWH